MTGLIDNIDITQSPLVDKGGILGAVSILRKQLLFREIIFEEFAEFTILSKYYYN